MKIILLKIAITLIEFIDPSKSPTALYTEMVSREINLLSCFLNKSFEFDEVEAVVALILNFYPLIYPGAKSLSELRSITSAFALNEKEGMANLVRILLEFDSYIHDSATSSLEMKNEYAPFKKGIRKFLLRYELVISKLKKPA